jgi:hypothetical protein
MANEHMTSTQSSRLSMLYAVRRTLIASRATWSDHTAFAAAVGELETLIAEIEDAAEIQLTGTTGHTREKERAGDELLSITRLVAQAASAYATVTGNSVLLGQLRITRHLFTRTNAVVKARRCQAVLEAVTPYVAQLQAYGIDRPRLDALQAAIARYEAAVSAPRLAVIARKAATSRIRAGLKAGTSLLRARLDGLMAQFTATAPAFHRDYFNARIIVDAATAPAEVTTASVIPLAPPAAQQAA